MEKLNGHTKNITDDNIAQLKQLFPDIFREGKVDFDHLSEILGHYVNDAEDHYNFTWHGKRTAGRLAQTPSTGTLRPDVAESVNFDTTKNIFIEGDNLEVLKLLQKSYHRKIKMIYIDPPYNTGNDFVYTDNFADNLKNYLDITGQTDSDGKKTTTNSDTSGRYHTNWLNMIYPRLKLARNLLSDDGVIFISIDDNEQANLKKVCDEVFGEENFVGCLPTIMNLKGNNDEFGFAGTHEYTLVFAKQKSSLVLNDFIIDEEDLADWQEDEIGFYKKGANLKATGQNAPRERRPNLWFPLYVTKNDDVFINEPSDDFIKIYPITNGEEMSWRWSQSKFLSSPNDIIISRGNNDISVYKKQRPSLGDLPSKKPKSIFYKPEYSSGNGTAELKNLFDRKLFDAPPKPPVLIKDLISIGSNPNDIILDFFAGSGTTAHAVMALNAEDNGNRQFICVQIPEKTFETSEAFKAGYKTIAEISKERIRRAGAKIKSENPMLTGDVGFKVFKLDTSNLKRWDATFETIETDLINAVDYIKADRSHDDLLYELLIKLGLDLSVPIEKRTFADVQIYIIGLGALVVCLDDNISLDLVDYIGKLKAEFTPENNMRVVFRDHSFFDDSVKTNTMQILKRYGIEDVKSL